jgi:hypothetical protein
MQIFLFGVCFHFPHNNIVFNMKHKLYTATESDCLSPPPPKKKYMGTPVTVAEFLVRHFLFNYMSEP